MPERFLADLKRSLHKPKKRKAVQQAAKNKADLIFSRIIRSAGVSEHCGNQNNLQTAHWLSRRYSNTRTDFDNAFCLCASCHRFFTADPTAWALWALSRRGRATYERLREAANRHSEMDWPAEVVRLTEIEQGAA